MNLSELIPFLKSIEAHPKKRFSQNFLTDSNIIEKIVDLAEITPGDAVLEIGPGPGALTSSLLKKGAKVYAVELDRNFAHHLHRLQNGNLTVFENDFLKFPMALLPPQIKVVANLPYHITTPILEKLFAHPFSSITIMVQKEVASRMIASPNTKTFGSLSLFVQFYSKIHSSFPVSASCFYPKPKVDSTVIRLDATEIPKTNPLPLIHKAFQKRRKMLTSSLSFAKTEILSALEELGIRTDARPEMLSLNDWILLEQKLSPQL